MLLTLGTAVRAQVVLDPEPASPAPAPAVQKPVETVSIQEEPFAGGEMTVVGDTIYNPTVIYSPIPKAYEIAGVRVTGTKGLDDYLIISNSGLTVGERVEIPGSAITDATKRFWRQNLYSKVQITVEKIVGDKAWLVINLRQQPRMSEMRFSGVKGGEKKDIEEKLSMVPGQQITPNIVNRAKEIIKNYYSSKGFKNAQVNITQVPDIGKENQVILDVDIDRNNKVKVHKIYINGNNVLSDRKVKRAMKKTNENGDILNLFKQKKFVDADYRDDKIRIIDKYNEPGIPRREDPQRQCGQIQRQGG